jgi:hypothetical protein
MRQGPKKGTEQAFLVGRKVPSNKAYSQCVTLWHADRKAYHERTRTTMMTPLQAYLKLKRQAKRLMLTGDVERYLQTLRALNELRMLQRRGLA